MAGPLDGIKVIEIGQALAGPLAGSILGDMGAEVIKIEKPDGGDDARLWGPPFIEGDALFFHAQNRNKKSVTIDITDAEEVARLKTMVADADIVIQNLRPGLVEKFGIAPDDLLAVNPRLIYCSIWAFGYQGPLRLAPGFDPLLQAYGGLMTLTGRASDPPTFAGAAVNDKTTGMWCVIGALAGLQQRHSTGKGCVVDTSLFESAVALVEGSVNGYMLSGNLPERTGTASNLLTPYQTFETADRPICIAAGNDRLFVKLAKVMGHPEWASDSRFENGRKRADNRPALIALMDAELSQKPRDYWMALIESVGVPCAPVNDIGEVANSPQLAAMDMVRDLPGTDLKIIGLPISFDRQRPHPRTDSPKLGQHNSELKPR
ncbi:MAG: CoA transferase [Alphaproteobacteria bacterium]|nr:CoA transferase [Alphaproteobacteria bacterium]